MIQDIPYESQTMFVSNNEAKQQRVELISTGQRAARRGSSEHLNTYILHTGAVHPNSVLKVGGLHQITSPTATLTHPDSWHSFEWNMKH